MVLNDLQSFFSLRMLDARLDPKTDLKRAQKISMGASKSRWRSLEFKIYYATFLVVVPLMVRAVMSATNETSPNYPRFEPLLSKGWIFGRKVDNSDSQYRFFRDNLPLLSGLVVLHTCLLYTSRCV